MASGLRTSLVPLGLTAALLAGDVKPEGVELGLVDPANRSTAQIIDANSREMVAGQLDIAEMSFGTYSKARDHGIPILALPVFPGRRFLQPGIFVRPDSGFRDPSELRGKRVLVGQYWQTAYVWHRIVLHQAHGVAQEEIEWIRTAPERWDVLPMPSGVKIGLDTSKRNPAELLYAGEADVYLATRGGPAPTDSQHGALTTLFADPVEAQRDYFRKTGIFPIIHLITIREEHATPSTVAALCEAFGESKRRGLPRSMADPYETPINGGDPAELAPLFGDDAWPYGVEPNRHVLNRYLEDVYAHQHLTDRHLTIEELFPKELPAAFR